MALRIAEKEYLKKRIEGEIKPIQDALYDKLKSTKAMIREEVLEELGVRSARRRIDALLEEAATLNIQYEEATGEEYARDKALKLFPPNYGRTGESVVEREVERRMLAAEEANEYNRLKAVRQGLVDEVMMAGYPKDLQELVASLPEKLKGFRELAGMPSQLQLTGGEE